MQKMRRRMTAKEYILDALHGSVTIAQCATILHSICLKHNELITKQFRNTISGRLCKLSDDGILIRWTNFGSNVGMTRAANGYSILNRNIPELRDKTIPLLQLIDPELEFNIPGCFICNQNKTTSIYARYKHIRFCLCECCHKFYLNQAKDIKQQYKFNLEYTLLEDLNDFN